MKKLVIVGDDFGFSRGVNDGIIDAIQNGILTEASLMVDYPGTIDAVGKVKNEGLENVGIHLTLNNLNGTGKYLRVSDYETILKEETSKKLSNRILDEFKKFEDFVGKVPTHINSHHSILENEKIIDAVGEYALKHSIIVRTQHQDDEHLLAKQKLIKQGVKVTDYFFKCIYGERDVVIESFLNDLKTVQENSITEILLHPGYVDEVLKSYSALIDERERDLSILKDQELKSKITDMRFKITNFKSLKI